MRVAPIFPLPETVLFPDTVVPFHLFEPRYRQLGEDAIGGDRLVVVVLLAPGWERDYEGMPSVYDIATLGRIEDSEKLPDGRINIVVRGIERVRLLPAEGSDLAAGKLYRVRAIEAIPEEREPQETDATTSATIPLLRERWLELLKRSGKSGTESLEIPERASSEQVINHIASFIDVPPPMKQALLEENTLSSRGMKLLLFLDEQLKFWRTLAAFRQVKPEDPTVN